MKRTGLFLLLAGIAGLSGAPAASGSRAADMPHSEAASLRKQYALFQSLSSAKQQQIRELDQQLHAVDPATQQRLRRVLENYSAWLDRLSEVDRKRVASAPNAESRLVVIREIRQNEWLDRLPKAYHDQYKAAKTLGDRAKLIEKWRQIEQEREEEWQIALKHWNDLGQGRIPAPFQNAEFVRQIDQFVANLDHALNDAERAQLRDAAKKVGEEGNWLPYGRMLVVLADRHPLLPSIAPGPRTYDALSPATKAVLPPNFAKKPPKSIEVATGRWPDYSLAIAKFARDTGTKLPEVLGPTNREQLPPEARNAVSAIEAAIKRADPAQRDLQKLKNAEGSWPAYPERVMELAKQYKVAVPGWTLPAPQQRADFWNTFRAKREKPKAN